MNKFILPFFAFVIVSCVPSRITPETFNLDRDRRWRNCSFYIVDHDCGMIVNEETRDECALNAQADYLSES